MSLLSGAVSGLKTGLCRPSTAASECRPICVFSEASPSRWTADCLRSTAAAWLRNRPTGKSITNNGHESTFVCRRQTLKCAFRVWFNVRDSATVLLMVNGDLLFNTTLITMSLSVTCVPH